MPTLLRLAQELLAGPHDPQIPSRHSVALAVAEEEVAAEVVLEVGVRVEEVADEEANRLQ